MSLRHAILGLLTFEPMSGYTLKSRYFDKSVAYFWPADQAQIYRTLQALEADGAVSSETVENDKRPNQKQYSITGAGERELREWLAAIHPPVTQKDGFLVQLYFARMLSRHQILRVLQAQRDTHRQKQDHFDNLVLPAADTATMKRQVRFGGLTLDYARRREKMLVEWLDACIAAVQEWPEQESI